MRGSDQSDRKRETPGAGLDPTAEAKGEIQSKVNLPAGLVNFCYNRADSFPITHIHTGIYD